MSFGKGEDGEKGVVTATKSDVLRMKRCAQFRTHTLTTSVSGLCDESANKL